MFVEQNCRSYKPSNVDIMFTVSMHTLGNGTNKSRLISAISSIFDQAGITVEQATSDADTFVYICKCNNCWEEIFHQLSGDGSTTITH